MKWFYRTLALAWLVAAFGCFYHFGPNLRQGIRMDGRDVFLSIFVVSAIAFGILAMVEYLAGYNRQKYIVIALERNFLRVWNMNEEWAKSNIKIKRGRWYYRGYSERLGFRPNWRPEEIGDIELVTVLNIHNQDGQEQIASLIEGSSVLKNWSVA